MENTNKVKTETINRRQGEWLVYEDRTICSECFIGVTGGAERYCPICGAKMTNVHIMATGEDKPMLTAEEMLNPNSAPEHLVKRWKEIGLIGGDT